MKAVLVTGAGKRIGRAIAVALAADGWYVFVHYNRSEGEADDCLAEVRAVNGDGETVKADLAKADEARALIRTCLDRGFDLACVVNNASAFNYDFPDAVDGDVFADAMNVNLLAPMLIAESYAKAQAEKGAPGCIINMLDNKVFALNPDFYSYTLSKAGLHAATKMMAMAYAPMVRACGIAPGITLISGNQSEESFQKAHKVNLLESGCEPADIVRAVRFIVATPAITGEVLTIDSGHSLMRLPRDVAFLGDDHD